MKKKVVAVLLCAVLVLGMCACGAADEPATVANTADEATVAISEESAEAEEEIAMIETDENLLTVEVTIQSDFVGETTQEQLDEDAGNTYKSATLNEDGSVTYVMSKAQHKEMLETFANSIDAGLEEMVSGDDFPQVTAMEANNDYTEFTVTTTNSEISLEETFLCLGLYMYGGYYQQLSGTTIADIIVYYVNADSGEVIDEAHYKDMLEE